MFARIDAKELRDLLLPMAGRAPGPGVYFARLCFFGADTKAFLWAYHEAARQRGVVIEGQLSNPDERQLNYLNDVLGPAFAPDAAFIGERLSKWMPRMAAALRSEFADALSAQLTALSKMGKTESVLKTVYCKMLCWLYYRFERLTPFLGGGDPPRVLYETDGVTQHEMILLRILSSLGADILLLTPKGDQAYLRQDPESRYSQLLPASGAPFPADFSLKALRREMRDAAAKAPAKPASAPHPLKPAPVSAPQPVKRAPIDPAKYFTAPRRAPCANAWMKEAALSEILTPAAERGTDPKFFYTAFLRLSGVSDKLAYENGLYQFYQRLRAQKRAVVIADGPLPMPAPEETQKIRHRNYRSSGELIVDLAGNLPACADAELQRTLQAAFVSVMRRAAQEEENLNRLTTAGVYLLCFVRRYQAALFQGYKSGAENPVFLLMGGCENRHDALYLAFLGRVPADTAIFAPDLSRPCALRDETLLEISGPESLPVSRFPRDGGAPQMRTVAAHAQEDLTQLLYTDSGLFRARQFSRGESITLRTTLDEIFLLWDQELRFRPNFSVSGQTVNMPVLYAKVSGVEGGRADAYWQKIKLLLGDRGNAVLIPSLPYLQPGEMNPYQALAIKALKNGVLRRDVLAGSRQYPFSLLREELQAHILDKLQIMLDRRLIRGTYENGTEYTVIATVLNLKKELLRLLQKFDFTKTNPKAVCVSASDRPASLEDAILFTFLNLAGFDVVLFVPTGYQVIENRLNGSLPVEHQAGEYLYDLRVPDLDALPPEKGRSWLENLWKRGK